MFIRCLLLLATAARGKTAITAITRPTAASDNMSNKLIIAAANELCQDHTVRVDLLAADSNAFRWLNNFYQFTRKGMAVIRDFDFKVHDVPHKSSSLTLAL